MTQLDVVPFDNVPPCDNCMERARITGSYAGVCANPECEMGTLKSKLALSRQSSTRSLKVGSKNQLQRFDDDDDGGFASTAFRGSQESLLSASNFVENEVLENVESSV